MISFRPGTLARRFYEAASKQNDFYIDDAGDLLFEEENKQSKIFCISRNNCSSTFIRYLDYFGKIGGFDGIIERIESSSWCPMEILKNYL